MTEFILNLFPDPQPVREALAMALSEHAVLFGYFFAAVRVALAVLAVTVAVRCAYSMLHGEVEQETWCYIDTADGLHLPVPHWENIIGRSSRSDVVLNVPTVSRRHAALIRESDGSYTLRDLNSRSGVYVDGQRIYAETPVEFGTTFNVGGVDMWLMRLTSEEERDSENRPRTTSVSPSMSLYLLTVYQLLLACSLSFNMPDRFLWSTPLCFIALSALMWAYFIVFKIMKRVSFEIDIIAFFLSTLGLAVSASSNPESIVMQFLGLVAGLALFLSLGTFLRDLSRAERSRWLMGAAAIALLASTLVFGTTLNGARNWIFFGGLSFQPSELAKVAFVYAGTATLDRLFAKRNLVLFLALMLACAGMLAVMADFGAVLIFFVAYLVAAYLRSGDIRIIAMTSGAAAFGGVLALKFKPYILARFASWRHVWEVPHDGGYQQTRTMSAAASGGFFGTGAGTGWLKTIPAADTDLVFGCVSEELGLLTALSMILCVCALALFAAKSAMNTRSTFYSIAACTASSIFVFQAMLNVFGSVDLLPLTGVTFPFVSNGGSSLVSCFGLLAFIKAADTRQNASFASPLQSRILRRERR